MFSTVLYAVIGTIWVVSLTGIFHLASYVYHTIKDDSPQSSIVFYFWDAPRRMVSFLLAVAIFYAGMARQVTDLPHAIALQMAIRPPIWPADIWLMMSLFCFGLATLLILVSVNWSQAATAQPSRSSPPSLSPLLVSSAAQRSNQRQTQMLALSPPGDSSQHSDQSDQWESLPTRRSLPALPLLSRKQPDSPVPGGKVPALPLLSAQDDSAASSAMAAPLAAMAEPNALQRSLQLLPERLRPTTESSDSKLTPYDMTLGEGQYEMARGATSGRPEYAPVLQLPQVVRSYPLRRVRQVALSAAVVFLFLILGWQVVTRIGGVVSGFTMSTALQERATPTPTSEVDSRAFAVEVSTDSAASGEDVAAGELVAVDGSAATGSTGEESASASVEQPTAVPTLPAAATETPTPVPTPTPSIVEQQHVLVQNQYGVNARSEPSLSGIVQTILARDTRLPLLERTADQEWIRVAMTGGGDAWVAASVVTIVEAATPAPQVAAAPPTATPTDAVVASGSADAASADISTADTATVDTADTAVVDTALVSDAIPTNASTTTVAENVVPAATTQPVTSAGVSAAAQSYTISLLEPENGFATAEDVTLRWSSGFGLAANQAFEPVVWRAGGSSLADGVSLGAPMQANAGEVMQIEARLSSLESGEYRWGVLLVQQDPYQRLALMSGEWAIFVE